MRLNNPDSWWVYTCLGVGIVAALVISYVLVFVVFS